MMAKLNKLESLEDRLKEVERVLVGKGHLRATTKQGAAIAFVVEHLETLKRIVAEHQSTATS